VRKRTKHEFWVKRGGLGAFVLKNSTASFFAPEVAKMALGNWFRTSFVDRNPKCENTPNTFVSKNLATSFFGPEVARSAVGARFTRVLSTQTKSVKMHET
jgi:hypothetical protein